ncbi:MAG: four helix bundle protein [Vicinamibacterales bacterium]
MQGAKTFEDLIVWRKAHECVLGIYRPTGSFPREEVYGLTAQVRKAAVSIPANIAEGFKRRSRLEKVRFLNISQGSAEEIRYYLRLGRDLGYGHNDALGALLEEVSKLLEAYRRSIIMSLPPLARPAFSVIANLFWILDSGF